MSIRAISSAVNASFIRSFQGLAGSDGPAIGANAGQSASIYSGLRLGARTFATSIQNLNSAVSIINMADSSLKKLSEVVDGMINLAEKATSVSAGAETRRKLQGQFEDLVDEFREVVEGSQLNDIEYLAEEGLATLFQRVGLDQETSDGVAAVLAQFVKPTSDDSLASEDTKGARPAVVPVLKKSKVLQESNESLAATGGFGISPDYSVYSDSANQSYSISSTGLKTSLASNDAVSVVNETQGNSVGETTGYSIVSSTDDPLTYNPTGSANLFLLAPDGSYVRQITDNSTALTPTNALDISADNKKVLVSINDFNTATSYLNIIEVAGITDAPSSASSVVDPIAGWPFTVSSAQLSNGGMQVIYKNSVDAMIWKEVAVGDKAIGISSPIDFGFADSRTGVFLNSAGTEISAYNADTQTSETLIAGNNITHLTVLEADSTFSINDGDPANSPKIATIAYVSTESGTNELTVLSYDLNSGTLKTRFRRDLGAGTVEGISLAYQNDGNTSKDRVDVGVKGDLPSLYGDSDTEIYRVKEAKFATNSTLFSQASSEPSKILDGNLFTRADSYRLLGDLRALKSQIGDNLDALDNARQYIADNIELVRVAGFAFLEVSEQLTGAEEAEEVAKMVAAEIRKNASQAQAAQAENLQSVVSQTTALLAS